MVLLFFLNSFDLMSDSDVLETISPASSVDDVQRLVDQLVLSTFEAIRNQNSDYNFKECSEKISSQYQDALLAIDSLVGICSTKEQQESTIALLSEQLEISSRNAKVKEQELIALQATVNEQLQKVVRCCLKRIVYSCVMCCAGADQ